jgi:hypothetical protein
MSTLRLHASIYTHLTGVYSLCLCKARKSCSQAHHFI